MEAKLQKLRDLAQLRSDNERLRQEQTPVVIPGASVLLRLDLQLCNNPLVLVLHYLRDLFLYPEIENVQTLVVDQTSPLMNG